mmetsp:Transcript_16328/g.25359  ORF Transcript_16328/g.25359 Transcript_16328/m.25359 type:complete len:112 (+) Transcript_16328:4746-5081(+)
MRVVLRRNSPYRTKRNRNRISKTPGRKLKVLKIFKKKSTNKCELSKTNLRGIGQKNKSTLINLCHRKKTVSRPYGGALSGNSLVLRIKKAFLFEEQKIVKMIIKNEKKLKN